MFSKENIIYLAAESENILDSVEEDKVYVIGGLVDHNSKKVCIYTKLYFMPFRVENMQFLFWINWFLGWGVLQRTVNEIYFWLKEASNVWLVCKKNTVSENLLFLLLQDLIIFIRFFYTIILF